MTRDLRWWIVGAGIGVAGLSLIVATSSSVPSSIASSVNAPVPAEKPPVVSDSDGLQDASPQGDPAAESDAPPAYRLATLNAGAPVETGDPRVLRFRSLLRTTALQVPEPEPAIAEMTVQAWQTLQDEHGVEIGLLELMERANGIVYSPAGAGLSYAELTTLLIGRLGDR